jgi:hypothetical protein
VVETTGDCREQLSALCSRPSPLVRAVGRTMSVIAQVHELVAPLRHDAQGILEERHDDEESRDDGQVSVAPA